MVKNVFNVIHLNRHAYILSKDYYLLRFCNSVHFVSDVLLLLNVGMVDKVWYVLCSEQGEWQVII
jgi:hypothetical protein